MARSNRLLAVGGVVTLVGAGLVLAVLTLQRPAEPVVGAPADPPVEATVTADDGAATPVEVALSLPDGFEALALTVDFEGSVAGLPEIGDRVHVYGVPVAGLARDDDGGRIARLLEDVEVIAVTGADHATNGGNPTVVLAVEPSEVATTLSSHGTSGVHLTLVEVAAAAGASPTAGGDDAQAGGS